MSYKLIRQIVPAGLPSNPNRKMKSIDYITIHTTGNRAATADALAHAKLQSRGASKASWHYTVDKLVAYQSFEDDAECWHAGDGNGKGNTSSIGIEICVNDRAGFAAAVDNTAQLTADLLKKHKLGINRVKQHNNWSGKDCPKELRSGEWGITWAQFLEKVRGYLVDIPKQPEQPHWAEKYFVELNSIGVKIEEKRFDHSITRGEVFKLLVEVIRTIKGGM